MKLEIGTRVYHTGMECEGTIIEPDVGNGRTALIQFHYPLCEKFYATISLLTLIEEPIQLKKHRIGAK